MTSRNIENSSAPDTAVRALNALSQRTESRSSRPEGLHLQPLLERSVNLSAHSAPIS